jgi:hypothetical protein
MKTKTEKLKPVVNWLPKIYEDMNKILNNINLGVNIVIFLNYFLQITMKQIKVLSLDIS